MRGERVSGFGVVYRRRFSEEKGLESVFCRRLQVIGSAETNGGKRDVIGKGSIYSRSTDGFDVSPG